MKYRCVIAPVSNPTEEQVVEVEADNRGQALIENFNLRPGTFVKEITEIY